MEHILINQDCFLGMDKLIKQGIKVDAIITDIPFGTTNRHGDNIIPFDKMWEYLYKIRKDEHTPIILFSNGMFTAELMLSNKKHYKYRWVWNKVLPSGHLNAKKQPMNDFDDICVFYEKQPTYNPQLTEGEPEHGRGDLNTKEDYNSKESNYGSYKICTDNKGRTKKQPKRIITIQKDHPSKVLHSQQKPTELLEYFIKTYTNVGDTVLDFTMGSGSLIKACENTGRIGIGIDNGKCDKKKSEFFGLFWKDIVKQQLNNTM